METKSFPEDVSGDRLTIVSPSAALDKNLEGLDNRNLDCGRKEGSLQDLEDRSDVEERRLYGNWDESYSNNGKLTHRGLDTNQNFKDTDRQDYPDLGDKGRIHVNRDSEGNYEVGENSATDVRLTLEDDKNLETDSSYMKGQLRFEKKVVAGGQFENSNFDVRSAEVRSLNEQSSSDVSSEADLRMDMETNLTLQQNEKLKGGGAVVKNTSSPNGSARSEIFDSELDYKGEESDEVEEESDENGDLKDVGKELDEMGEELAENDEELENRDEELNIAGEELDEMGEELDKRYKQLVGRYEELDESENGIMQGADSYNYMEYTLNLDECTKHVKQEPNGVNVNDGEKEAEDEDMVENPEEGVFYGFLKSEIAGSQCRGNIMASVVTNLMKISEHPWAIRDKLYRDQLFKGFEDTDIERSYSSFSNLNERLIELEEEDSYQRELEMDYSIGGHFIDFSDDYQSLPKSSPTFGMTTGRSMWSDRAPPASVSERFPKNAYVSRISNRLRGLSTPLEAWQCFFTESIIEHIAYCTNQAIKMKQMQSSAMKEDVKETNSVELKAFFGLLYLSGLLEKSQVTMDEMWSTDGTGIDMCLATMTLKRFKFLMTRLQFSDGHARSSGNVLEPVADVLKEFLRNCQSNYSLGQYATVHEKIQFFRGKCEFVKERHKVQGVKKKCGIRTFRLMDSNTCYVYNMVVRTDRELHLSEETVLSISDDVKRLIKPISGSGRTVVMDQKFTTILLELELLQNHHLTSVGLISRNRCDIQNNLINLAQKPPGYSKFAFTDDLTLASYVARKGEVVHVLSSCHHLKNIDPNSGSCRRPRLVSFYDQMMGNVEEMEKDMACTTLPRKAFNWPLSILYSMLDMAAINSTIILGRSDEYRNSPKMQIVKEIASALVTEQMTAKLDVESLNQELKLRLRKLTNGENVEDNREELVPETLVTEPVIAELSSRLEPSKARCDVCPRSKDRKTKFQCTWCDKRICGEHSVVICEECCLRKKFQQEESFDACSVRTSESSALQGLQSSFATSNQPYQIPSSFYETYATPQRSPSTNNYPSYSTPSFPLSSVVAMNNDNHFEPHQID